MTYTESQHTIHLCRLTFTLTLVSTASSADFVQLALLELCSCSIWKWTKTGDCTCIMLSHILYCALCILHWFDHYLLHKRLWICFCSHCNIVYTQNSIGNIMVSIMFIESRTFPWIIWRASVWSRSNCTVDPSSWEKQLLLSFGTNSKDSMYSINDTSLYYAHRCRLLPSGSEATPHENIYIYNGLPTQTSGKAPNVKLTCSLMVATCIVRMLTWSGNSISLASMISLLSRSLLERWV